MRESESVWSQVEAEIAKPRRHLRLVGVIRNARIMEVARRCAWCRRWFSFSDMQAAHKHGAKVSHGCCASCERKFYEQMEQQIPTPPSAA